MALQRLTEVKKKEAEPKDSRFSEAKRTCSHCGAGVSTEAVYCGECGSRITKRGGTNEGLR